MDSYYFDEKSKFDARDPLGILYKITFRLIQIKVIKMALIFTFFVHLIMNCLHFFEILSTFDADLLVKYGPTLFPLVYGLATIIFDLMFEKKTAIVLEETFSQMWSLDSTGSKTAKKIKKESKILIGLVVIDTILATVAIMFYLPIMEWDIDIYYAIRLFEMKFSPTMSLVFSILYYATIPVLFFSMLCTTFALFYIMSYEKFQTYAINDLLKNISIDYQKIDDWKMMRDQSYQNTMYKRLTICIQRHQLLKRMEVNINQIIFTPI
ncbi:hypothetical protein BDFB_011370, partial [Asbolus verrucosus]